MNVKQTVLKHTVLLLCMLAALPVSAGIQFSDGDINKNNDVLFTVRHNIAGINSYRTLFKANIKNGTAEVRPEILTYYPEQMELLNGGKILQIRNRYGTVWYSTAEKKAVCKVAEKWILLRTSAEPFLENACPCFLRGDSEVYRRKEKFFEAE